MFMDPTLSLEEMEVTFSHCSKNLIQRFSDSNERNRDTAIRVFLQYGKSRLNPKNPISLIHDRFMERGANVIPVLPHTIALVVERLGGNAEPSEEVRLLLVLVLSSESETTSASCPSPTCPLTHHSFPLLLG